MREKDRMSMTDRRNETSQERLRSEYDKLLDELRQAQSALTTKDIALQ